MVNSPFKNKILYSVLFVKKELIELLTTHYSLFTKTTLVVCFIFLSLITSGYKKPDVYVIDASKDAQIHNNRGVGYRNEKCYYAAIQEFKIAISLSPNTQATAVYYTNLGDTLMEIGYPEEAQDAYERALSQYSLNLLYYKNLVKCFKARNIVQAKIQQYSADKSPLGKVMLGLLYAENNDLRRAIITLDDFVMSEPDLMITRGVKQELRELVKKANRK
jgi:tetratricopeptide (TPR) repeat protein